MNAPRLAVAVAALLAGATLACSRSPRQALIGTWQADRAATVANADACSCATPQQRAWMEANLDRMRVEYTADKMTAHIGKLTDGGTYAVEASGPDWLDLKLTDIAPSQAPVHRVWIDGDTMRVRAPHIGFEEIFHRVQ